LLRFHGAAKIGTAPTGQNLTRCRIITRSPSRFWRYRGVLASVSQEPAGRGQSTSCHPSSQLMIISGARRRRLAS
jgi:hypothetical protein